MLLKHAGPMTDSKPSLAKIVNGTNKNMCLGSAELGTEMQIEENDFGPYTKNEISESVLPKVSTLP